MTEETITTTPIATATVEAPITTTPTVTETQIPSVETVVEAPVITTVLGETPEIKIEPTTVPEVTQPEVKTEEGLSEEPAPPPVYEAFKFPDELKPDEARVKEFTDILSDLEVKSKAEHALVQEFGQKAVDYHIKEIQRATKELTDYYTKSWEEQKVKWKDTFLADPEIGGNRFQTTVDSALNFIRTHGGTEEQQKEFRALMDSSGLGNHPAMIRLLAKAGSVMSEGKPLAANQPVSNLPKSRIEALYGPRKK